MSIVGNRVIGKKVGKSLMKNILLELIFKQKWTSGWPFPQNSTTNVCVHGLQTPNEGINQRNLKIWADVADKICFGHTLKCGSWFSAVQRRQFPHWESVVRGLWCSNLWLTYKIEQATLWICYPIFLAEHPTQTEIFF